VTLNPKEDGFNYISLVDLVSGRKQLYEAVLQGSMLTHILLHQVRSFFMTETQ
jgi:hypothetical protein